MWFLPCSRYAHLRVNHISTAVLVHFYQGFWLRPNYHIHKVVITTHTFSRSSILSLLLRFKNSTQFYKCILYHAYSLLFLFLITSQANKMCRSFGNLRQFTVVQQLKKCRHSTRRQHLCGDIHCPRLMEDVMT